MNKYFNEAKIESKYPEAGEYMIPAAGIWKLPDNKQDKLNDCYTNSQYFLTEKIDGCWYEYVRTENHSYLFGRTKSTTDGLLTEKMNRLPHIEKALEILPAGTVIIGEVYLPGGKAKDIITITGCLPDKAIKRQKENPAHYYLHDIIFLAGKSLMDEGAEERYKILESIWELYDLDVTGYLHLAKCFTEDLEEKVAEIWAQGGEGAVLKKKDAPYTPDKKTAWHTIKVKEHDSVDLVCMGFCESTKIYTGKELDSWIYWEAENGNLYKGTKNEIIWEIGDNIALNPITKPYFYNWCGALRIGGYNEDGELIEIGTVSSGLTDKIREEIKDNPREYINKVISLSCMLKDKKEKTLRHPVFESWRFDKNPEECVLSEIFK